MSVAVASGLILSETSPTEESQNEAGQRHENGHADTQSDDRRHIGFQPRSVRFFKKTKLWNYSGVINDGRIGKGQLTWEAKAGLRNGFERDGRTECRPATTFMSGALVRQGADGVAVVVLTRLIVEAIFAQLQSCSPTPPNDGHRNKK